MLIRSQPLPFKVCIIFNGFRLAISHYHRTEMKYGKWFIMLRWTIWKTWLIGIAQWLSTSPLAFYPHVFGSSFPAPASPADWPAWHFQPLCSPWLPANVILGHYLPYSPAWSCQDPDLLEGSLTQEEELGLSWASSTGTTTVILEVWLRLEEALETLL